MRPRLISTLRRPWTVFFAVAFTSVAYGFIDLGMGISILRLDNPELVALAPEGVGGWLAILGNSAAFWTGLILAAAATVISSTLVFDWHIAPRGMFQNDGKDIVFPDVDKAKAVGDLVRNSLIISIIFAVGWMISIATVDGGGFFGPVFRFLLGWMLSYILCFGFLIVSIFVLDGIRDGFNQDNPESDTGAVEQTKRLRLVNGLDRRVRFISKIFHFLSRGNTRKLAIFRQNFSVLIMFLFIFAFAAVLSSIGALISITTISLLILILYVVFKIMAYFTILYRYSLVILAVIWLSYAGSVSNFLGIVGDGRNFDKIAHLNL